MARISCALALACLAWFAPGAAAAGRADQGLQQRARAAYSADDIVVHARSGATAAQLRDALTGRGLSLGERIPHTRLFVVRTNGRSVSTAIHSLAGASAVANATPDYVRHALDTPNDPYFASDEPYFATIRTPEAWDLSHGSRGVTIAVVDTGVTRVEDLAGQLLPGRNIVANTADARDDTNVSHGTLVAGIAAATTNNGLGIAGVGWNTSVLPVKVLNAQGAGADFQIAAGIVWAVDNGAKVVNLSLGGKYPGATLCDTVDYAISKGAVAVAAAGNGGTSTPMYPAACPGVVAVSATDTNGDFASFSNYGPWLSIAAPGIQIMSTRNNSSFGAQSGTSLAAPMVSGVAALLWAQHPDWTPSEIGWQLEKTAQDRGPAGLDQYYGYGLLDAYAALGGPTKPSAAPSRDSFEPNDDVSAAKVLSATTAAKATISPEGDVDWYIANVRSPAKLTFLAVPPLYNSHVGPNFKPVLQIYDESMNVLARSEDSGFGFGTQQVAVARVLAGRYYLRVANEGGAQSGGSYSVSVAMQRAHALRPVLFPS